MHELLSNEVDSKGDVSMVRSVMAFRAAAVVALAGLVGCTEVKVHPVSAANKMGEVCIVHNPAVLVSDFVDVLKQGLKRHHLDSVVVNEDGAAKCSTTLTYTALRSWDFKPYITYAELHLWQGGQQIADASYHLRGKGGLDFKKWQGTRAKMDPVIDALLGQPTAEERD